MNPFKKLASQTAIYGLPTIIGRLLNYFLVPLYTYKFSTSEYGIVTEMYAYVAFLMIILTYGMETTLFRFSQTEKAKDKVYSTALISIFISTLSFLALAIVFSPLIAELLKYSDHTEYIFCFALIICMDVLAAIPFAKLREQNKAKRFALIKSVNILVNILLNLFFIAFCKSMYESKNDVFYDVIRIVYHPNIGIGYIFISNLIASAITLLMLFSDIFKTKQAFDLAIWKKMMCYTLPLLVAGLAGTINETLDRVLLKHLWPDEATAMDQVGIYGACYKVSIIMTIFIQTFRYAAEPFFFSHAKEKDAKKTYADVMKYFVIACSFIFLGTMMYMDVIQYFVGQDFRAGLNIVPILLLANLCLGVFFNLSIWYKLTGDTRFGAYLSIFGAFITLIFNFYLIPRIGYLGSAWATLVCYASMMLASYFIGQNYHPINYDLKSILGYLALSLALYALSICLESYSDIKLVFNTLLLGIFIAAVYLGEIAEFKKNSTI